MKDPLFLAQKSTDATKADQQVVVDLLDTLRANLDHCVGMAANMIGVKKNIIVVAVGPFQFAMINPKITKKSGIFETEEGLVTIEIEDIYYFEYSCRRVIIHTTQGNYFASYSLKELYEKFKKYNFESPHKSFIVNLLYLKRIKGFDILLENNDIVPLAQKRAVDFKNKFNDFLQSTFDRIR